MKLRTGNELKARGGKVMDKIKFFKEKTENRVKKLGDYYSNQGLFKGEKLNEYKYLNNCSDFDKCSNLKNKDLCFWTGGVAHVGSKYDFAIKGKVFRIVVTGIDYGEEGLKSLEERRKSIEEDCASDMQRNKHMKGTADVLKTIFEIEKEDNNEFIEGNHVFEMFALVNYLKCSVTHKSNQVKKGKVSSTASTNLMYRNCSFHYLEEIKILKPSIIIFQGTKAPKAFRDYIEKNKVGEIKEKRERIWEVKIKDLKFYTFNFYHPSARGRYYWRKHFKEVVTPTIKYAKNKGYIVKL